MHVAHLGSTVRCSVQVGRESTAACRYPGASGSRVYGSKETSPRALYAAGCRQNAQQGQAAVGYRGLTVLLLARIVAATHHRMQRYLV
jgi:hypothetical protein